MILKTLRMTHGAHATFKYSLLLWDIQQGKVETLKSIRVGIVGTGFIANAAHIPSLISLEMHENIIALCDINKESLLRTANRYGLRTTYSDHKEMLRRENLDCVFCLVGPKAQPQVAKDCLESGVDILCEKPLAWTIQESKGIIEASKRSGRWVQMGYNRRFMPIYKKAKEALQTHQTRLCLAEKSYEVSCLSTKDPEHFLEMRLIHAVDVLNWFCGEALHVKTEASKIDLKKLDTVCALIRYKEGAFGLLIGNHSGGTWIERSEIYGDNCTALVEVPLRVTFFSEGKREVYEPSATYHYPWHQLSGYQQQDEHFIECVRKDIQPLPSAKDGLETLNLINEILKTLGLKSLE